MCVCVCVCVCVSVCFVTDCQMRRLLGSKDLGLNIYNHILNVLANREQNMSSLYIRQCLKV